MRELKLFISVPRKGRTDEEIDASIEQLHRIAETVFSDELEIIPSYIDQDQPSISMRHMYRIVKPPL